MRLSILNKYVDFRFGVHRSMPFPSSMVEIYAVYIGRDKLKALQLYGSIEVSTLGNAYYCFNREASDAFGLLEGSKNLPLLDGSLEYDDCDSFEVKIDLKDVEGLLCIKGYVNWDDRTLEHGTRWLNLYAHSLKVNMVLLPYVTHFFHEQ